MPHTVDRLHEHWLDPIKGSRFRARVYPAADSEIAHRILAELRAAEPDATHHTWAYRLRDGSTRASDDGEPAGSAGRPILARLEGQGWIDVLVVVSRWYGGTKLGVGGLIRAYGGATSELLAKVPPIPWVPTTELVIHHSYADSGTVEGVLNSHATEPVETRWLADVTRILVVEETRAPALCNDLVEATGGRARVERR